MSHVTALVIDIHILMEDLTHSYAPWLIHKYHDSFIFTETHRYTYLDGRSAQSTPQVNTINHTQVNESCCYTYASESRSTVRRQMSHVTYEWVMSHTTNHTQVNESCHYTSCTQVNRGVLFADLPSVYISTCHDTYDSRCIWMSHGTYEWVMSHMNESCHIWLSHVIHSCHIWMSHGTYKWVMVHMNESRHTCMSHGTYEWVMVRTSVLRSTMRRSFIKIYIDEPWYIWTSHGTYEWVMVHINESWCIWMSHGTYKWVMVIYQSVMIHMHESRHIWMRHGASEWVLAHMNGSWYIWMSHGAHEWVMVYMNESCHIRGTRGVLCADLPSRYVYRWVMVNMNESWYLWMSHGAYEWVMLRTSVLRSTLSRSFI